MTKKTMFSLVAILAVVAIGGYALAQGPGYGYGRGMMGPGTMRGPGYGPGMMGYGYAPGVAADEETNKIFTELYQKQAELNAVLSAEQVDEAKAKTLVADISKLQGDLEARRLQQELEFRKNNPNFKPGYGPGYGPRGGSGRGYGSGCPYWN